MGVVGRLNQYASMQVSEFDDYSMSENLITHSSMSGWVVGVLGSGGSLPTGWVLDQQQPGSTITIIGGGIENGLNYVDIRFSATSVTTSNRTLIRPGNAVSTDGSTYYLTSYSKLVSGSSTNLTHTNFHTGSLSLTSTLTRNTGASAVLSGTFFPRYDVGYNGTSVAYDITIRFAAPQLEKGSSATDYTSTRGTAVVRVLSSTTNTNITGFSTYYSSGFDENVGFTTFLPANISPPYDPVYDEFGGTFFGAGQGRYMRQYTDKSVIVYNEIDEVTDFRDIVRTGLVLDLDAAQPLSYKGTGTAWNDLSGNGNNGTLTNGPTYSSSNGGSIVFDGGDDYSTSGALSGSFASFSTIIWFYPTSVTNFENPIDCNYAYNGTTGNIGPRLEMTGTGTLAWIYSNDTANNSNFYSHNVVSSGLAANTWHCAAITYDSGTNTSTTYYNGNSTGLTRTLSGTPTGFIGVMNNVNLGRGFHLGGAERPFTGRVSNVQIYNRALTAAEVSQNYNALKHRFGL